MQVYDKSRGANKKYLFVYSHHASRHHCSV